MTSRKKQASSERDAFLKEHRLSSEEFATTGLDWDELDRIATDHKARFEELKGHASYFSNLLQLAPAVHSVRFRVKDPGHLVAKVIRKCAESPGRRIRFDNYKTEVTDLIGVRALHLVKDQWRKIHRYLTDSYPLHESPVAYHRTGDSPTLLAGFQAQNCRIQEDPDGYRSVHYVVNFTSGRVSHLIEVQVRTVFEEGWAEIDHMVRYPRKAVNNVVAEHLKIFSTVAGTADEMGTFLMSLREYSQKAQAEFDRERQKTKAAQRRLDQTLSELRLSEQVERELRERIAATVPKFATTISTPTGPISFQPLSTATSTSFFSSTVPGFADTGMRVCSNGHAFSASNALRDALGRPLCPVCHTPSY